MYDTAALIADITEMMTDNVPTVVAVAVFLAAVKFVINWIMYALLQVSEAA